MSSKFPTWKYILLAVIAIASIIYALPNAYGEDPAVQITGLRGAKADEQLLIKLNKELTAREIKVKSASLADNAILIRFFNPETQINAQDLLKALVGEDYSVALNLAPVMPQWLQLFAAKPMKLGLDLMGGVRFLMEVDVSSSLNRRLEAELTGLRSFCREHKINYKKFVKGSKDSLQIQLYSADERTSAMQQISNNFPYLELFKLSNDELEIRLNAAQVVEIRNYTMEQTTNTLRNRVNELGVAEAIVQRQGVNRIVVELPGIQDTARAKDILGKTATVDFVMVDHEHNVQQALQEGIPVTSRILTDRHGRPILIKRQVVLTGESIIGASSGFDARDNLPIVNVRLGGSGTAVFRKTTLENIGKQMAVVYRETRMVEKLVENKLTKVKTVSEKIISAATIQSALGSNFQISGLTLDESRDLALLLRAGALPATISIVEEKIVGPSMGQENITLGVISVSVGLGLVLLAMAVYYHVFGIIANIALLFNLVLLVAIMSILGATLTLPGIAGIVLTLGMAVDANVLIFERIREELRLGMSPLSSISHGFEHAFATIVDANLTTLIVGIILFAVGTGPVKGFAVTLSIGIVTSMFTTITGTRAMVSLLYERRHVQRLFIGV